MIIHFMWNTDPDYDGVAALCDHVAGLEEPPRQATMTSALPGEVTCTDCRKLMLDSFAWRVPSERVIEILHEGLDELNEQGSVTQAEYDATWKYIHELRPED